LLRNIRRILRYLRPQWHLALGAALVLVASGLVELLSPWPLKLLVDHVLGSQPLPSALRQMFDPSHGRTPLLVVAVAAGFAVALIENGLSVLNDYLHTAFGLRMGLDLRCDLFQHAQRLSLAFHDRRHSSMLIYAINAQADGVSGLITTILGLLQSAITLGGMFWIVWNMDRLLALLSMVVLPVLGYLVRYYATRIQSRLMSVRDMEGALLALVHEAISMQRVILAFGREPYEHQRFCEQGRKAVGARVGITVRQTLFALAVNMTTAAGAALVLGFGAYRALRGELTIGQLLVVMSYVQMVYRPLENITHGLGSLQDRLIAMRIIFDLLDTPPEITESPMARPVERVRGRVSFENVGFAYQGREDTLRNISFEARPGTTVAIVGPTGAGKTTLVSLLPRFYDPQQGRILLDGIDIRELMLRSLRDQVSIVLQEPLLFSDTVAENIRYGRLEAGEDEIVEAARAANAHDFISRLPNGYQTELGERGVQLSGGERQRICLARAFLRNAPILILDEPTSAVDSRTEAVILEALERLMAGRTTFLIAHRLSTIRQADVILVLDRGRLVQAGTHADLMACDGLYRQLWEMQVAGADAGTQLSGARTESSEFDGQWPDGQAE
jgi:ABC-type multidrug transport system fused ATPase/permease subunit